MNFKLVAGAPSVSVPRFRRGMTGGLSLTGVTQCVVSVLRGPVPDEDEVRPRE